MSDKKPVRSGLGRGLSALMADVASPQRVDAIREVPRDFLAIDLLIPNPNQPRRDFAEDAMRDLADSIRQKGVIQPLIVRQAVVPGKYEIVAGERRWRAAQMAGLHEVPVLVRDYDDEQVLEIAILENIQRADLNAVEEALAYRQLMDRFGHTQEQLAHSLSRSRSHIANTLRLLSLSEPVLAMVREGRLSAGHARALITSPRSQDLAVEVLKRGLSVRETERLAKQPPGQSGAAGQSRRPLSKDADTIAIENDLSANLHMLVQITHNGPGDGGMITIKYRSLDQLDMLCDVLSKIPRDVRDSEG
jgi:ParB family chromosome partitioning protein